MANKKYVNAKCFVFSENGYEEITYIELCHRCEHDKNYKDRKFIPLHGMLVEVTAKDYIDFYTFAPTFLNLRKILYLIFSVFCEVSLSCKNA